MASKKKEMNGISHGIWDNSTSSCSQPTKLQPPKNAEPSASRNYEVECEPDGSRPWRLPIATLQKVEAKRFGDTIWL